jgi:hypothetical protein
MTPEETIGNALGLLALASIPLFVAFVVYVNVTRPPEEGQQPPPQAGRPPQEGG